MNPRSRLRKLVVLPACLALATAMVAGWRTLPVNAGAASPTNSGPPITIPVLPGPWFIAAGKINSDAYPDIFVSNASSYSIILNNGAGGFLPPTTEPGSGFFSDLKDVNNDAKLDLVYLVPAFSMFEPHKVHVRLGDGMGGFAAAISSNFASGLMFLRDTTYADFNNDNFLDMAVSTSGPGQNVPGGNVFVLLGNGSGGFAGTSLTINSRGADLTAGDFNQNNSADIAQESRSRMPRGVLSFSDPDSPWRWLRRFPHSPYSTGLFRVLRICHRGHE